MMSCGPICGSIIVGHIGLGCCPITGKFDLNIGCGPIKPPPPINGGGGGGGGGSYTATSGFYVPLPQKISPPSKTALISITMDSGRKWRKLVAITTVPHTISVQIDNILSTRVSNPVVLVSGIHKYTINVATSFKI